MSGALKLEERAKLEDQASALQTLVTEGNRDLATTVKELEAFTYSVAHDLRAPLRAIHSFSDVLIQDYAHQFSGEPLDYLHRISAATERMSQLIDDLLKLSRIGRGQVERQSVDLSIMITEVCARLAEREVGRHVRLDIQNGIVVQGDARLLLVAMENLIENAWKFTRRRDLALIRFFEINQDGRRCICISDNGAGFDMRYQHKLFAPFQRLHLADDFEGTGIGLVIVSRVIARHGGEIRIEGKVHCGAKVTISFPIED